MHVRHPATAGSKPGSGTPPLTQAARIESIPLDLIYEDPAISPRLKLSPRHVAEFAAMMRERGVEPFPAVVLGARGEDSRYPTVDGRHRIAGARLAGVEAFHAVVLPPMSARDLFAEAVRRSGAHGLRLTNKEKARAVDQLLRDFSENEKTTRELAEIAGVSHTFVANRRRRLREGPQPPRPRPPKPPQHWMERLLGAYDQLGALADDPRSIREVNAQSVRAALKHYEDTDAALHLEALAEWALELRGLVAAAR